MSVQVEPEYAATTKQDKAIAETRYRAVVRTRKEDKNDY
jgi:hypothetical protein